MCVFLFYFLVKGKLTSWELRRVAFLEKVLWPGRRGNSSLFSFFVQLRAAAAERVCANVQSKTCCVFPPVLYPVLRQPGNSCAQTFRRSWRWSRHFPSHPGYVGKLFDFIRVGHVYCCHAAVFSQHDDNKRRLCCKERDTFVWYGPPWSVKQLKTTHAHTHTRKYLDPPPPRLCSTTSGSSPPTWIPST